MGNIDPLLHSFGGNAPRWSEEPPACAVACLAGLLPAGPRDWLAKGLGEHQRGDMAAAVPRLAPAPAEV